MNFFSGTLWFHGYGAEHKMNRLKNLFLAATASGLMVLGATTGAHAALIFSFNNTSTSTPSLTFLESVASITNPDDVARNITLMVTDTDFFQPTAPPALRFQSSIDITVTAGSADNTISFISCLSTNNVQFDCGAGSVTTPDLAPLITSIGSFNASSFIDVTTLAAPYALTANFIVNLGAGSTIAFTGRAQLAPLVAVAVPEPAPLALLIPALMTLGWLSARNTVRRWNVHS
jgi:hypothetical protein